MTTRLYLTAAAATYVPPTLRGTYNDTSLSANAFRMIRQKSGANALASVTETSTTNNYKAFHGKWVTDPLAGGSVATTDSITITIARQENNASANMTVYLTMYVTTGDSDTVRVTLLDPFVGATEFATTMTAFSFTLTFDRAGSITQGDRIVLELGYNAQNTSATSFNGDVRYGGTDATDLATSGTTGVTVRSPWVEFNTAIDAVVASSVKPPAGNASGTGTANNAGPVVTAMAGNASGTGTANQPSSSVTQPAGNASGTGTSNTPGTMRAAELASGTGTANDATVATSASNTTAAAELASGTGTANQPSIAVVTNAGSADGTGTANQPSIAVVTNAGSSSGTGTAGDPGSLRAVGHASGTGTANQPSVAVVANAGSSSGTGTAGDVGGGLRSVGNASGTGTANQPSIAVIATTSSADGTGTANQPGASVVATAGNASGTGTANTPLGTVRYFLTATPSTQTSDAATGSWDDTTGDGKFELGRLAAGTAEEVSRSESDATADFDVLLGTWVSPPVADGGPVAIGQVLNITVARFGAPSGSNLRPRYRMYVMSPLGVNRGDLFNLVNTGLIFNETTPTGMSLNAALTAGGTINPGDRFVLELGFRHQAANATTRTGSVYAGGTSGTILTASDTDTSHPGHVQLPAYFGPIVTASAELASGTGTANDATAGNTVAASAELASGTGTANDASILVVDGVLAGVAGGDGAAYDASILVRSHGTSGWYGLLGTLRGTNDAPDDDLACPYDGEPLHADHNGDRVCPFDGWRPAAKGASRPADGPWSVLARSAGMAAETPDVPAGWGPVG